MSKNRDYHYTPEQLKRMEMRKRRVALRRKKERQKRILFAIGILIFVLLCIGGISALRKPDDKVKENGRADAATMVDANIGNTGNSDKPGELTDVSQLNQTMDGTEAEPMVAETNSTVNSAVYQLKSDAATGLNSPEVTSTYALMVDLSKKEVVAQKNAYERINPASMTKILTLLVASEHVSNLDDTFTMTLDITDYAYVNDCSSVGFLDGEVVTVKDLLYGTILPSGGDAAVGLATYVAGSQEAFVDMMNQKIEELGLADSAHFTNCVGLYDENHYCSIYDMAVMLEAAMENDLCRQVLNTRSYTTSLTEQHPEGITVSNWFMRRIEDKEMGGTILGAKTGYVVQSGSCAASCYERNDGAEFICVTADAHSSWRAIYDHVAAYNIYAAGNTSYTKQ
ncbi:MAG: D-alanyl-D-alanine carboxypeptidase [Lachnospiraceae bacterium]|nr:D-alanyl-D-alanine carboxypeptidase [Lachnospiraceae bacterium]